MQLSGTGFSTVSGQTEVSICDLPCEILPGSSASMLECSTERYWLDPAPTSHHSIIPVAFSQVQGSGTESEKKDNAAFKMFDGQVGPDNEWRCACILCHFAMCPATSVHAGLTWVHITIIDHVYYHHNAYTPSTCQKSQSSQVAACCRSSNGTCEFSIDWHPYAAELSVMRIFMPAELADRSSAWEPHEQLSGLVVEVSDDRNTWQEMVKGKSAAPFTTGWTELNIDSHHRSRYLRVRIEKSGNSCAIPEIEFIGATKPMTGPDACDIGVTVFSRSGSVSVLETGAYSYDKAVTPVVTSISPSYGTAAGGTSVTITGQNLPLSVEDAYVDVDGVQCSIMEASSTAIVCLTGERQSIPDEISFSVSSVAYGLAVLGDNTFAYKDLWSSRVTWAGLCQTSLYRVRKYLQNGHVS